MDIKAFQKWLDHTGVSLLGDDLASYSQHIETPFTLITSDGNAELTTQDQVRDLLNNYQTMFKNLHVTSLIRLAKDVKVLDAERIEATYVSHVFSDSHRLFDPFTSVMVLRRSEDVWRVKSVTNNLTSQRWPLPPPSISKSHLPKEPAQ